MSMYGGNRLNRGPIGGAPAAPVVPDENYQHLLYDGLATSIIGPDPTYTRATPIYYYTGADPVTGLTLNSTSDAMPVGARPPYVDSERTGGAFHRSARNDILRSEEPATTWAAVGSPSSITNATGTWGPIAYGTIVAAAGGDGITQASVITAASRLSNGSAWMATDAGTLNVTITLAGSGATPNTVTRVVRVGTQARRYHFWNAFAAGTSGNVSISFTANAAGTLYIGGIQLEALSAIAGPPPYVKTTTAVATRNSDLLYLSGDTERFLPTTGSFSFWYCPYNLDSDLVSLTSQTVHQFAGRERATGGGNMSIALNLDYRAIAANHTIIHGQTSMVRPNRYQQYVHPSKWVHIGCAWELRDYGVAINAYSLNGELMTPVGGGYQVGHTYINQGSHSSGIVSFAGFPVNGVLSLTSLGHPDGVTSNYRLYPDFKLVDFFKAQYDAEKQYYTNRTHLYGYPTAGRYEHGVVAQWLFDEASGDIVDEVGGITLTATGADLTYAVPTTAYSAAMPTGISNSGTSYFTKAGAESALNIGTASASIEFVLAADAAADGAVFDFRNDSATPTSGFSFSINRATATWTWQLVATDGTTVTRSAATLPASVTSGGLCKHRLSIDRSYNRVHYFINERFIDSTAIATLNGKSINCENIFLLRNATTAGSVTGALTEFRQSVGSCMTNSGGPLV